MNSEVNFFNLGRSVPEILRRLRANLYLENNPSEACPAQWQTEGDKTLTPSAALVGKVGETLQE